MKAKHFIAGTVLAASTVASSVALAESPFTGNISVTNNYIWRGVTQTDDAAAVQGGLDYGWEQGFYIGTWLSNLSSGYELDFYGGYAFDWSKTSWDVGVISYEYPVASDYFREAYLNFGWEWLTAGAAYTFSSKDDNTAEFSKGDLYLYVGAEFEVAGLTLGGVYGDYDFDAAAGTDYSHLKLYMSKSDFTFALDKNDIDVPAGTTADEIRATVSYTKSFDL